MNEKNSVFVDVYNQTVCGEIAPSLTAASGGANTSGPKVLERKVLAMHQNGSGEIQTSDIAYTVGTTGNASARNTPLVCVLNDQGGAIMSVSYDVTATLRAQEHGHAPIVLQKSWAIDHVVCCGGNCTAQGPCYYEEKCPTMKAGGVHAVAVLYDDES